MDDYYALLGVSRNASMQEVKVAYKKKILKYHPDKNPDGADIFKEVNQAYDTLKNPATREKYDLSFFAFIPPTRERYQGWTYTHRKGSNTWNFRGKSGKSRVNKVRVETSDGYFDIEFRS